MDTDLQLEIYKYVEESVYKLLYPSAVENADATITSLPALVTQVSTDIYEVSDASGVNPSAKETRNQQLSYFQAHTNLQTVYNNSSPSPTIDLASMVGLAFNSSDASLATQLLGSSTNFYSIDASPSTAFGVEYSRSFNFNDSSGSLPLTAGITENYGLACVTENQTSGYYELLMKNDGVNESFIKVYGGTFPTSSPLAALSTVLFGNNVGQVRIGQTTADNYVSVFQVNAPSNDKGSMPFVRLSNSDILSLDTSNIDQSNPIGLFAFSITSPVGLMYWDSSVWQTVATQTSIDLQTAYNNDPSYPIAQIALPSGGELDITSGSDIPFAAVYNKGILSTLGLRILPSDNTEAFNVLITNDTASTFAEMVSSSRGVVAYPAMNTVNRAAIPLTSAPFGLGITNTDYSAIDFYDTVAWQTCLTIANIQAGTNVTLDKSVAGKVTINASGGGSSTPAEYSSFSIQNNPGATTFAASNTFYPIVLGGTFYGNDSNDFTNQFMTISGTSTPVMTCGSSVTQFYNVNINIALRGATPTPSNYIISMYVRQSGGTIVPTQYRSIVTINDMVNLLDISITGNVQLSNGDSVFVAISNLTNTSAVYAAWATFSIISMSGSASTVTNADNVGTTVNSSNASFYLPFVASSSSGYQPLNINSGINYNPSTNTLSADVFSGTATNAQNVLTNSAFTNLSFYPTFVASSGGGLQALRFNSTFNFNPATGVLFTPNLTIGALSANQLLALGSGNLAVSIGAGTTTTVLHGNASGLPTYSAVSLTADVSGTLGFTNGGLGFNTTTTGDLFLATATNTPGTLAAVASGAVLASAGTSTEPTWSTSPTLTGLNLSGLTASQAVVTNGSKNLASLGYGSANTASTLVERDGSGNFSAGTITATLSGNASTASTATVAQTIDTFLTTTNSTFFIPFVTSNSTAAQALDVGSLLTINPSTGLLTSTSLTLAAAGNLNLGNNVVNVLTINSATGAVNRADIALNRFDSTNGNCRLIYETAGTPQFSNGIRSGTTNYTIFDEINSLAQLTVSLGSGTSGVVTVAGALIVGQPGQFSLQLPNQGAIAAKNSGGTLETFCYPRFTDNRTYIDIGGAGLVMRQNAAGTTWLTVDTSGNASFAQGNVEVTTATAGYQQKSAAVSAGTANATLVTGVVLSLGASGTINNSAVTTSHIGFAVPTTVSGTATQNYQVTCGSGSFSVTGGSLDNSTLAVWFLKAL